MTPSFGIYVHIPFCIQRCTYCDFATYAKDQIAANDQYIETLCQEIEKRAPIFETKELHSLYFGGGTPSLLTPAQIDKIISTIQKLNLSWHPKIEVTMEVNPATLDKNKLLSFKASGINRMSIGCQTFDDQALKDCNREHDSKDTVKTIELVSDHLENFSLDLLFSLPKQRLKPLEKDVERILSFDPPHVSAYCLTVPDKHPMNQGRCSEEEQLQMFDLIHESFREKNLLSYEISNFAKPGFESVHNNLYWLDQNFWGVGLSAHSYKKDPDWGYRFWNPSSYKAYMSHVASLEISTDLESSFPSDQREKLSLHESITDYCHTHLRLTEGLPVASLRQKYGENLTALVIERAKGLESKGLLKLSENSAKLTRQGLFLSNQVFAELLFSRSDVDRI